MKRAPAEGEAHSHPSSDSVQRARTGPRSSAGTTGHVAGLSVGVERVHVPLAVWPWARCFTGHSCSPRREWSVPPRGQACPLPSCAPSGNKGRGISDDEVSLPSPPHSQGGRALPAPALTSCRKGSLGDQKGDRPDTPLQQATDLCARPLTSPTRFSLALAKTSPWPSKHAL